MNKPHVEKVRKLDNFEDAWLVSKGADYFVVSGVDAPITGWEVLVFPADENGEVTDWGEVAGGRGVSHNDAIAELARQ